MSLPKVSIIIPVYNVYAYLRECLESIRNQSLQDIEVLCINDGSTDNSGKILDEFKNEDNRFVVIHRENMGVAYTRNEALKLATGEYISFLDPDDYYPGGDVLKTLYDKAKENEALVCGGSMIIQKGSEYITAFSGRHADFTFTKESMISYKDYQHPYGYQRFIFSRKLLIENDIYFPLYQRYQDPPFFIKAIIQASNIYVIPMPTYCYRKNHYKIKWTDRKINDFVRGLTDNLKISSEYNLPKLHIESAAQFKNENIINSLKNGNLELLDLLIYANKQLNIQLLRGSPEFKNDAGFILYPLSETAFMARLTRVENTPAYKLALKVMLPLVIFGKLTRSLRDIGPLGTIKKIVSKLNILEFFKN